MRHSEGHQTSARRGSRSVAGCLTCRRRRVKCNSRSTPCDACRRLRLSCVSSFHQNFRSWSTSQQRQDDTSEFEVSSPFTSCNRQTPGYGVQSPLQANSVGETPSGSMFDELFDNFRIDMGASGLDAYIAPDNFNRRTDLITTARQRQGADTIPMDPFAAYQALFPPSILHSPQSNTEDNFTPGPPTSSTDPAWDVVVWSQYMNRVPEWLSTKSSIWSCYHYLINLAQAIPNSPLFHGILSWTYAYLFRLGLYSESSRVTHYTTASQFVRLLSDELSDRSSATSPASFPIDSSEKLSQYISTTFFLCHHDLIVGDFNSFIARINETKVTFRRHWKHNTMPGIIESRIVIWLAFMELRFLFLGGSVDPADHEQQDLMGLLVELNALSTLRGPRKQQSYLRECFGNGLPNEENDQELGKERCREKFDVIFSYLSKLRSFEVWESEKQPSSSNAEPLLKELREAKIDALRADLARIHAVSDLKLLLFFTFSIISANLVLFRSVNLPFLRICWAQNGPKMLTQVLFTS